MGSLRSHPVLNFSFRSVHSDALSTPGPGSMDDRPLLAAADEAAAADDAPPSTGGTSYATARGASLSPAPGLGGPRPERPKSRLGTPPAPEGLGGLPQTQVEDSPSASKGTSLAAATVILSKTIMGAGAACRVMTCCSKAALLQRSGRLGTPLRCRPMPATAPAACCRAL